MVQSILMPKLGQTVEESTIVKWHKTEGDPVKKGEVLFEIETDKAVLEAESFYDGTLLKVLVPEGKAVPVSSTVAFVGEPGEEIPADLLKAPPPAKAAPVAVAPRSASPATPVPAPVPAVAVPVAAPVRAAPVPALAPAVPERLRISPRARALARRCAVDASPVRGSGPGGRIVERDVEAYLNQCGYASLRISPSAKSLATAEDVDILSVRGTGDGSRIRVADVRRTIEERPLPMSKMRQVIAERLTHSFTTTPHFYVTTSIDMTDLFVYRQELKARDQAYSVTDFILEAVILSLQEVPTVNSSTDGRMVRTNQKVHLGVAVTVEEGLLVPVVFDAEELTMRELHERVATLAARAREGTLLPDEMKGGTFTVSNMGMMDVENFCAIINPGEGAILAVASTVPTPVVRDGQVVVRSIMKVTLSTDHRIVDGATGAVFINSIKTKLEDMELWKSLT